MVFYPRYGLILSNIQRNWFAISSDARRARARKVLQFNFEECWTVLIHTSDKRPSHSHCYQVNNCQVAYIRNILLLKGGQYFWTEKKYVPPFSTKNYFISKRRNIFLVLKKNMYLLLVLKIFLLVKGGQYFLYWSKNTFLLLLINNFVTKRLAMSQKIHSTHTFQNWKSYL